MKILEVTVCHRADDTRIYQKYVKSLLEANVQVGYVAPYPEVQRESGLTLISVKSSGFVFIRLLRFLKKIPEIYKFSPDFVHLHDPELLLVSPILRLFGFQLVYDMHENFARELDDKPISRVSNMAQKLVWKTLERFILNKIPIVFAEESYKKYFTSNQEVMVLQNFPREKSVSARYEPKTTPHKKPKFVYLGTISLDRGAIKMVDTLGKAFGLDNYELHFIGDIFDPRLKLRLESIFSSYSNVIYHGYKSMPEAWRICKDCDVGLAILKGNDNYVESYPTKLFEYLICGLPIVTSNFDLYRSLVEKHNVGICVNPGDESDIVEALRKIVENDQYAELSNSIGKFPFQKFTWESEFAKFLEYLRMA